MILLPDTRVVSPHRNMLREKGRLGRMLQMLRAVREASMRGEAALLAERSIFYVYPRIKLRQARLSISQHALLKDMQSEEIAVHAII